MSLNKETVFLRWLTDIRRSQRFLQYGDSMLLSRDIVDGFWATVIHLKQIVLGGIDDMLTISRPKVVEMDLRRVLELVCSSERQRNLQPLSMA